MTAYCPTIGQLKCILACHWLFSLCIDLSLVICMVKRHFYRHYKHLPYNTVFYYFIIGFVISCITYFEKNLFLTACIILYITK